ncbi:reductase-like protein [Favolaschia claudopus]|uniref:Reductase-like protein n=1 Tax=Favolaschia claudopus TaxID=2862362 RepID=A0AAW0B1F1_9AGAR
MTDKTFPLNTGQRIPALGLGMSRRLIRLQSGYKLVDGAYCYANEDEVGAGLKEAFDAGVKREGRVCVTKVWNTYNTRSLKALGLDYHWPILMNPEAPDGSRDIIRTHNHVKLVATGKTKAIGVCNYSKRYLEQLLAEATIVPAVNQIENHPGICERNLSSAAGDCRPVQGEGIHIMAYKPVVKIAEKHGVSPSTVLLSYHISRGSTVLPKSVTPERIKQNMVLIDLDAEDQKLLQNYSDQLTKEGKLQRFVYPPFNVDFGFPDKS